MKGSIALLFPVDGDTFTYPWSELTGIVKNVKPAVINPNTLFSGAMEPMPGKRRFCGCFPQRGCPCMQEGQKHEQGSRDQKIVSERFINARGILIQPQQLSNRV